MVKASPGKERGLGVVRDDRHCWTCGVGRSAGKTDAVSSELLEKCSKGAFTAPCFGATTALVRQGRLVASCPLAQVAEVWASTASELLCCTSLPPGSCVCYQTSSPAPQVTSWAIHTLIRANICPQRAAKAPLHVAEVGDEYLVCKPCRHGCLDAQLAGGDKVCMGGKMGGIQTLACNCVSPQFLCRAQRRRRKERRSTCTCTSSSSQSGKASPGKGFVLLAHTFPDVHECFEAAAAPKKGGHGFYISLALGRVCVCRCRRSWFQKWIKSARLA